MIRAVADDSEAIAAAVQAMLENPDEEVVALRQCPDLVAVTHFLLLFAPFLGIKDHLDIEVSGLAISRQNTPPHPAYLFL